MTRFENKIAGVNDAPTPRLQWRNTLERFGLRAQLLHLLLGSGMAFMLGLGFLLDFIPDQFKPIAYTTHKGLGLWVLFLGVLWLLHYFWQPTPAPLPGQSRPGYRIAKLVHKLLLLLCIFMPLSGWIMVSAGKGNPVSILPALALPPITAMDPAFAYAMKGVHIVLAWSIVGLLALHALGALYHHVYKRDPILKRMWPRFTPPGGHYRFNFDSAKTKAKKQR